MKYFYNNLIITSIFLFVSSLLIGQDFTSINADLKSKHDSILSLLKSYKNDTSICKLNLEIGELYEFIIPDTALYYYNKANLLAKNSLKTNLIPQERNSLLETEAKSLLFIGILYYNIVDYKKSTDYLRKSLNIYNDLKKSLDKKTKQKGFIGIANCYNMIGIINGDTSNYEKATKYHNKALQIRKLYADKRDISASYNNLGAINIDKGLYTTALDYILKALRLFEEFDYKKGMSDCYTNIGVIYHEQNNFDLAIEFYKKSLEVDQRLNDPLGISICYTNIGTGYHEKSNICKDHQNKINYLRKADEYYQKALKINLEIDNIKGIADCYSNIANVNQDSCNYDLAIEYYNKALDIYRETEQRYGTTIVYNNLSDMYISISDSSKTEEERRKNLEISIQYGLKSLQLAQEINTLPSVNDAAAHLKEAYKRIGDLRKAFDYGELYITTKDSLFSEEKTIALADLDAKYKSEKAQYEFNQLNKEKLLLDEILRKQRIIIYSIVVILIFTLLMLLIIIRLLVKNRKASKIISDKNKEINKTNEQLKQFNNELGKKVDERTKELKDKNISLNKLNEELRLALEKAKESDQLKSAFLANMSHEIRTPMNGILGFVDLLKNPDLKGNEREEFFKIIEKSGSRLLNTLQDIVDISIIEAGQIKVTNTYCNLNNLVDELYEFFLLEAKNKGIQFSYLSKLPSKFAIINSDKLKLNSIFTNLIKNSLKYTLSGKIEFGFNVNENSTQSEIVFFVRDTGIGIPKDRQEAIFDRFVQADIEDKQVFEGSGLGLSITKAYVEMLGGKIWLSSEENVGSQFSFSIPFISVETDSQDEKPNKTPNNNSIKNKLKLLIVEDDKNSVKYLNIVLKNYIEESLLAQTGTEAVKLCEENPDIDIIFMDIKMPDMDGIKATKEIRKFNKEVYIIAQTAYAQTGDRERCIEAGCNDYITKPYMKEKIFEVVSNFFN